MSISAQFKESNCTQCEFFRMDGMGNRFCRKTRTGKERRFASKDPKTKPPGWCPRRLSAPIWTKLEFKDERCEFMEQMSALRFDVKERYIYPLHTHYKKGESIAVKVDASQFYMAMQNGTPLHDILPEVTLKRGEILSVDNGLSQHYFYFLDRASRPFVLTGRPFKVP